jgi:hypothetical protein
MPAEADRERNPEPQLAASPELAPAAAPVDAATVAVAAAGRHGRGGGTILAALARRAQAGAGNRALARRLRLSGSAVDAFKKLVEPVAAVDISGDDPATVAPYDAGAPQSGTLKSILLTASTDPDNDAKIELGRNLAGVMIGKFGDTQRIDMNDVEALEKGSPGTGFSKLAHEIAENYESHKHPDEGFSGAHRHGGIANENVVLSEMGVGGDRHSERLYTRADGSQAYAQDFGTYVLHMEMTRHDVGDPDEKDVVYDTVRRVPNSDLEQVYQATISGFAAGSDAVPGDLTATAQAAVAALKANPRSFVRIEGYRENTEAADTAKKRGTAVATKVAPRPEVLEMFTYGVYDMPAINEGGEAARKVVITVLQVKGVRD